MFYTVLSSIHTIRGISQKAVSKQTSIWWRGAHDNTIVTVALFSVGTAHTVIADSGPLCKQWCSIFLSGTLHHVKIGEFGRHRKRERRREREGAERVKEIERVSWASPGKIVEQTYRAAMWNNEYHIHTHTYHGSVIKCEPSNWSRKVEIRMEMEYMGLRSSILLMLNDRIAFNFNKTFNVHRSNWFLLDIPHLRNPISGTAWVKWMG